MCFGACSVAFSCGVQWGMMMSPSRPPYRKTPFIMQKSPFFLIKVTPSIGWSTPSEAFSMGCLFVPIICLLAVNLEQLIERLSIQNILNKDSLPVSSEKSSKIPKNLPKLIIFVLIFSGFLKVMILRGQNINNNCTENIFVLFCSTRYFIVDYSCVCICMHRPFEIIKWKKMIALTWLPTIWWNIVIWSKTGARKTSANLLHKIKESYRI